MAPFDFTLTNGRDTAQGWRVTDPVVPLQGYGGHPLAARPKRRGLTVWQGRQPFMVEIPMLLFRGGRGHSVDRDREALHRMATIESLDDYTYSHGVLVHTPAGVQLPIPSHAEWWVEDLTWGEEVREPPAQGGYLTRKYVTVKLLERVDDQLLGETRSTAHTAPLHTYLVHAGDTLAKIAAHFRITVAQIKKLNPSVRSDGNLVPNRTRLKLPTSAYYAPRKR